MEYEYEKHYVHLDSIYCDESNSSVGLIQPNQFTVHLQQELRNVVSCEILSVNFWKIEPQSNVAFIVVDELSSNFNSRTGNVQSGTISTTPSTVAQLKIPVDDADITRQYWYSSTDHPQICQYIVPIPKLNRLQVRVYEETGKDLLFLEAVFNMTMKFTCKRKNIPPILDKIL
jgi:hypothetical protein